MLSASLSVWANPSVLPYFHTFPINACTLGHGEPSPASQPLQSQRREGRPSVPGLLARNITTSGQGNLFPAGVCGDGDVVTALGSYPIGTRSSGPPRPSHMVQLGQPPAGRQGESRHIPFLALIL